MKKLLMLATAAFLVSGATFAHNGDGKKKEKSKKCCGKDGKCNKDKKEGKTAKL